MLTCIASMLILHEMLHRACLTIQRRVNILLRLIVSAPWLCCLDILNTCSQSLIKRYIIGLLTLFISTR